jgi:undecaprenyl diphosphate synthase
MAELDPGRIPRHVAVIMDGNGRWAAARDLPRTAGHAQGEHAIMATLESAIDLGIEWLTLFTFSTENWSRPADEVEFLMEFNESLQLRRRAEIHEMGVRVHFAGWLDDPRVSDRLRMRMTETERMTAANTRGHLVFAFNYGSRTEIAAAARRVAALAAAGEIDPADVDEAVLAGALYLPGSPDPDLVIRTSGEQRLSNFMLWQAAYSELVFTPVLWPDFGHEALVDCVAEYQARTRRFGGVG